MLILTDQFYARHIGVLVWPTALFLLANEGATTSLVVATNFVKAIGGNVVLYAALGALVFSVRRVARKTAMSHHPRAAPDDPELFLRTLLELGNALYIEMQIIFSQSHHIDVEGRLLLEHMNDHHNYYHFDEQYFRLNGI